MLQLDDLYQEVVIDHNRRPRNFRKLDDANRSAEGFNPLCGDQIAIYLVLEGGMIADIGFESTGCAISKASASMMTENVKGKSEEDAERMFAAFRQMVTRGPDEEYDAETLGDLELLGSVVAYPVRIKCATLSWHTLHAALTGGSAATTE